MLRRGLTLFTVGLHLAAPIAPTAVLLAPAPAQAAPQYRLGQRLRAKRSCTIKGIAIKKGVVLTVAALHKDDKGRVAAVDLSLSGMTISSVSTKTVAANFRGA